MDLDRAVVINQSLLDGTYDHRDEDMEEALKLGIEALKAQKTYRACGFLRPEQLLPGKTQKYYPPTRPL